MEGVIPPGGVGGGAPRNGYSLPVSYERSMMV